MNFRLKTWGHLEADQTSASWNLFANWLLIVDGLRRSA
jgi:hypothetical protein